VHAKTHAALATFVSQGGPLRLDPGNHAADQRVAELLSLIAATREFQMAWPGGLSPYPPIAVRFGSFEPFAFV
jgi:hypothetical protein